MKKLILFLILVVVLVMATGSKDLLAYRLLGGALSSLGLIGIFYYSIKMKLLDALFIIVVSGILLTIGLNMLYTGYTGEII